MKKRVTNRADWRIAATNLRKIRSSKSRSRGLHIPLLQYFAADRPAYSLLFVSPWSHITLNLPRLLQCSFSFDIIMIVFSISVRNAHNHIESSLSGINHIRLILSGLLIRILNCFQFLKIISSWLRISPIISSTLRHDESLPIGFRHTGAITIYNSLSFVNSIFTSLLGGNVSHLPLYFYKLN